jgi:ankyrin repeat protein
MSLLPPPQDNNPIITQFKPQGDQWELNDENITRIDPKTGETILHNYCKHINTTPVEVYRYLIETKGRDVNVRDDPHNTPLIYALQYFKGGDITVLMYLVSHSNVDVSIKGKSGYTLLHIACQRINYLPLDLFKVLIEKMGFVLNSKSKYGNAPIHFALESFNPNNGGDIAVLYYLLNQKDINVNIGGRFGYTLLHKACGNINYLPLDVFKVLIETLGCDVNVQAEDKDSPLHRALRFFNPNNRCDITVLTYLLTQKGVNINIKGHLGYNLLHIACQRINYLPFDLFKLLIETLGFGVNVQAYNQDTPLHCAIFSFIPSQDARKVAALTYLLSHDKVDVSIKGKSGYTLLHIACQRINYFPLDVFKLLIETLGCDVNVQAENKDTPIHLAFLHFDSDYDGSIAILTYLLNHKNINFSINDENHRNLLHWACICGTVIPDRDYSSDSLIDSNDDLDDSENSVKAKCDTLFYPIVEMILETCLEQILDETRS